MLNLLNITLLLLSLFFIQAGTMVSSGIITPSRDLGTPANINPFHLSTCSQKTTSRVAYQPVITITTGFCSRDRRIQSIISIWSHQETGLKIYQTLMSRESGK